MLRWFKRLTNSTSAASSTPPTVPPPRQSAKFIGRDIRIATHEADSAIRDGRLMRVGCYQLDSGKEGVKLRDTAIHKIIPLESEGFPVYSSKAKKVNFDNNAHNDLEYRIILDRESIEEKIKKETELAQQQYLRAKDQIDPPLQEVHTEVLQQIKTGGGAWRCLDPVEDAESNKKTLSRVQNKKNTSSGYAVLATNKNEDTLMYETIAAADTEYEVSAIFDGHGGKWFSHQLLEQLPQFIKTRLNMYSPELYPQAARFNALKHAFVDTNHHLKNTMKEGERSGATGCVALVHDNILTVANVGDTRAIVVDTGGAVTQVSEDATASDPRYQKSVIKRQGEILQGAGDIPRVGGSLIPARGFGDSHKAGISARPKITEKEISIGDIVIIASDGVWDWLPPDVVAEAVQSFREKNYTVEQMAQGIVNMAYEVHRRFADKIKRERNEDIGLRDDLSAAVIIKTASSV